MQSLLFWHLVLIFFLGQALILHEIMETLEAKSQVHTPSTAPFNVNMKTDISALHIRQLQRVVWFFSAGALNH